MPAKRRLTMRQLRQMLRLAGDGTSAREIAQRLGIARSTVQDNLKRAAAAELNWPLPGELTDDALENRLFARAGVKQGLRRLPESRRLPEDHRICGVHHKLRDSLCRNRG
nr:helix-turn-helix domain-containing protein [Mesorhizobium waimense]